MGQFMLLTEREDAYADPLLAAFERGEPVALGARLTVGGVTYAAADIKQATCLGGEGDLPFATPAGMVMANVDFRSETGGSISIQRDPQGMSVYEGRYVELADLRPARLRVIDGWTLPDGLK
jgi:hypothetical protein